MDFYLKTVLILLAVIVTGMMIYFFMTNAGIFQTFLGRTQHNLYTDMQRVLSHDIEHFENSRAVAGTVVLPLVRDVGSHDLAIFVQTVGQQGTIVNYGIQLRGVQGNGVRANARASNTNPIGTPHRAWEDEFVFSVRSVFGKGQGGLVGALGQIDIGATNIGQNAPAGPNGRVAALESLYVNPLQPRIGVNVDGEPWYTPTLSFWDTSHPNFDTAQNFGATFTTSGRLYTAQSPMFALERNHNAVWATTLGNPYYINMTSLFHSAFIVDAHGLIVGIYFEEQGVSVNASLLAQAQINLGMFEGTLPHGN